MHALTKLICYVLGKGLRNMNSLSKCHSVSKLVLDNNSITKIEKLDVFPTLYAVRLLTFNYYYQKYF